MDAWAQWMLHRRHGGDPKRLKATLDHLYPIRDRILNLAAVNDGATLPKAGTLREAAAYLWATK